ncbi:MAG TPA: sigma 54 modulation/S30EA ribosomal C-terminal domain-containing protein [Streptosporangiaceae bacterium]|nr:sigma 54 modulation/S30EA ribosomal C-terminal domain-containing protein [Streptosporangiaceae bacterium]
MDGTQALQVQIQAGGAVPEDAVDLAVLRVRSALRGAQEPVRSARVKLSMADPAVAQVNVDLDGRPVRVQAAAGSLRIAIMRMSEELPAQLDRALLVRTGRAEILAGTRMADTRVADTRVADARVAGGGAGSVVADAAVTLPAPRRPADESLVVRHKAYGLARLTPDEAIAELEMLGYEFHLFTELASDADSVVYVSDDGYRLALAGTAAARAGPGGGPDAWLDAGLDARSGAGLDARSGAGLDARSGAGLDAGWLGSAVTVSEAEVPRLTLAEAEGRLGSQGRRFLFFVDKLTGRGNVLYRRYGGGYGLITPVDA